MLPISKNFKIKNIFHLTRYESVIIILVVLALVVVVTAWIWYTLAIHQLETDLISDK